MDKIYQWIEGELEMVHLLTPAGAALWSTSWCAGSSASVTESGIIDPRKLPDLLLLLRKKNKIRPLLQILYMVDKCKTEG